MRPALLILCSILAMGMPDVGSGVKAEDTDWQNCLACHATYYSELPALSALRPLPNALAPRDTCLSCHSDGTPDFFAGDWTHPVRSIGEHIACSSCHPPVPHSAASPPPTPRGDYRAEQCFSCHNDLDLTQHSLSSHLSNGLTRCIDCHPPHQSMRALLPKTLLSVDQLERRGTYSSPERSNAGCMPCHSGFELFNQTRDGFVTVNTANHHRLHVVDNSIGCIECHDPHGSSDHSLMRRTLLTGELLTFIPTGQGASCSITCHGAEHHDVRYVNRLR
jgi:hypothetical protein